MAAFSALNPLITHSLLLVNSVVAATICFVLDMDHEQRKQGSGGEIADDRVPFSIMRAKITLFLLTTLRLSGLVGAGRFPSYSRGS